MGFTSRGLGQQHQFPEISEPARRLILKWQMLFLTQAPLRDAGVDAGPNDSPFGAGRLSYTRF